MDNQLIKNFQTLMFQVSTFFKSIFAEKEGAKQYRELLNSFLEDKQITAEEITQLEWTAIRYRLSDKETKQIQKSTLSENWKYIISDSRITESEREHFEYLLNTFELKPNDLNIDQVSFNKFYALALIEQGLLPAISSEHHDINIIFQKDEILHFGAMATLKKIKKITTRVNYGGLTGSIKIMKGVRFRVGSLAIQPKSKEILQAEDDGVFYITSQRIGFKGNRKQFVISYNKIVAFELFDVGMFIFKEGKESPYILTLDDYEVPLSMLSFILNDQ